MSPFSCQICDEGSIARNSVRANCGVVSMDSMEAGAQVRTAEGAEGIVERLRGRDASQMFLDVGHSPEARTMLRQFVVGKLQAVPRFLAPRSALLAAAMRLTDGLDSMQAPVHHQPDHARRRHLAA